MERMEAVVTDASYRVGDTVTYTRDGVEHTGMVLVQPMAVEGHEDAGQYLVVVTQDARVWVNTQDVTSHKPREES